MAFFGDAKSSANGQRRAPAPEFLRLPAPAGSEKSGFRVPAILAASYAATFSHECSLDFRSKFLYHLMRSNL
jgi:hypothetical protein